MNPSEIVAGTPVCPACERARRVEDAECPFCGVVYARYRPRRPAEVVEEVPAAPAEPAAPRPRTIHLSLAEKERLCNCAAESLEAGFSVQQFLESPALGAFRPAVREALRGGLEQEDSFAGALAAAGVVDDTAASIVKAGETQGKLPGALRALVRRFRSAREARRRALFALAYPTFLILSASVILPLPRIFTEGFGAYVSTTLPPVVAVGAVYVVALVIWPRLGRRPKQMVRSVVARVPPFAQIMHASASSSFADTLGAGVSAGLPVRLAVALACEASGHPRLAPCADRVVADLDAGQGLAEALGGPRFFTPSDLAMIGHGEQVGRLDEVLPRIAEEQRKRARTLTIGVIVISAILVLIVVVSMIASAIIEGFQSYFRTLDDIVLGTGQIR